MPSEYYTSYIPFITATPKEEYFPVGIKNRNQVGERGVFKNKVALCLTGLLCFILFNLSTAWAQSAESRTAEGQIQPSTVRLGEKVPESFFEIVHKAYHILDKRDTVVSFAEFADKLIIIDFYAYWCGPCIHSVNKFSELLDKYPDDDYLFVPVTSHSTQESRMLFDKYKWNLTTVIEDDLLGQFFPHQSIPHQVWIRSGEVIAMPIHTHATRENIIKAINGDAFKVFDKIQDKKIDASKAFNVQLDGELPLFVSGNTRLYGRLEGFQYANPTIHSRNDSTFYHFVNIPLAQVLIEAYRDTVFALEDQMPEKGIGWKVDELLLKRFVTKPDTANLSDYAKDSLRYEWQKERRFSYFSAQPSNIGIREQRLKLQNVLNQTLSEKVGITSRVVESKPKSFVRLYRLEPKMDVERKLQTGLLTGRDWQGEKDGIVSQKNVPFSQHFLGRLSESLNAIPHHDFSYLNMVLDETGIENDFQCYFEFPKEMWGDFHAIKNVLKRYGLGIRWVREKIPVILVTDTSQSEQSFTAKLTVE